MENLENALYRSTKYLVERTNSQGKFIYRENMDPEVNVTKKYNILRHAGAIYAMCDHYKMSPSPQTWEAIERAGRYIQRDAMHPLYEDDNILAIWSDPRVNGTGLPLQAKLGGTGLGLVALMSIEEIKPGFTPLEDLRGLGRFLVFMQKEDHSTYSKFVPTLGGKQEKWVSLYYPGEAALGLVMLYQKDPSPTWLSMAYQTLAYLANSRRNSLNIPPDHWALIATDRILPYLKDNPEYSVDLLMGHAVQVCEALLARQVYMPEDPAIHGAFARDGRTTPTATSLEGLLAALNFLPQDMEITSRIKVSVEMGINFLVKAQVKEGTYSGAMPRAVRRLYGDTAEVDRFNRRVQEVRIDYVQHAMSAMMQYMRMTA